MMRCSYVGLLSLGGGFKFDNIFGVFGLNVGIGQKTMLRMSSCIGRLLRDLGANNLLEEVSPGKYKQTPFTLALLEPKFGEWISFLYCMEFSVFGLWVANSMSGTICHSLCSTRCPSI